MLLLLWLIKNKYVTYVDANKLLVTIFSICLFLMLSDWLVFFFFYPHRVILERKDLRVLLAKTALEWVVFSHFLFSQARVASVESNRSYQKCSIPFNLKEISSFGFYKKNRGWSQTFTVFCHRVSLVPSVLLVLVVPTAKRWVFYHLIVILIGKLSLMCFERLFIKSGVELNLNVVLFELIWFPFLYCKLFSYCGHHPAVFICVADVHLFSHRVNPVLLVLLELLVPAVLL